MEREAKLTIADRARLTLVPAPGEVTRETLADEPTEPRRRLGEVLERYGLVTAAQLEQALAEGARQGLRLGQALVTLGVLTQDQISWALAHHLAVPYLALSNEMLTPALVRRLPERLLRRHLAIPLVEVGDELTLAVADPTDDEAIAELERASGKRVRLSIASATSIEQALDDVFSQDEGTERAATDSLGTATPFDAYLARAKEGGFDELRFRPLAGPQVAVTLRGPAGVAQLRDNRASYLQLLARLKRRLGCEERSDGFARSLVTQIVTGSTQRVHCQVTTSLHGEALTVWLTGRARAPRLGQLELDSAEAGRMRTLLAAGGGAFVAASGDPRANVELLYALLGELAAGATDRVVTLEQRARYELEGALQIDLEQATPRSASDALAGALAERPAALLLDSLGWLSAANLARVLRAALAGTVVLAGLEAPDPTSALLLLAQGTRPPALISVALRGVVFGARRADGGLARALLEIDGRLRDALLAPSRPALARLANPCARRLTERTSGRPAPTMQGLSR